MAVTIPDLQINNSSYTDLYASTGISVGTKLVIQNKSSVGAYLQIKAFQPASNSQDGIFLEAFKFYIVDAGEVGCWVKGMTKLCVQEIV